MFSLFQWDSSLGEWTYRQKTDDVPTTMYDSDVQDDDDIFSSLRRKSVRLQERRRNWPCDSN